MKPPPFVYHAPKSVSDALALLGQLENARILAGGQSLMPMLNMRFVLPDHIVDINGIADLGFIRRQGDALEIGALARQRDIEFSPVVRDAALRLGFEEDEAAALTGERGSNEALALGRALSRGRR